MAGHQELDPRLVEQVPLRADAAPPDDHPDRRRSLASREKALPCRERGPAARGFPGGFVMSVTAAALTKQDEERRGALVERLFRGGDALLEMFSIFVGDRLGLYRGPGGNGPSAPAPL